MQSNPSVAVDVENLASVDPWRPRGIKIHGRVEVGMTAQGKDAILGDASAEWSWGLQ